jgi:hypothetical protein
MSRQVNRGACMLVAAMVAAVVIGTTHRAQAAGHCPGRCPPSPGRCGTGARPPAGFAPPRFVPPVCITPPRFVPQVVIATSRIAPPVIVTPLRWVRYTSTFDPASAQRIAAEIGGRFNPNGRLWRVSLQDGPIYVYDVFRLE